MYSAWKVIDAEEDDLAEIDDILSEFRTCLYRDYPHAGSSVFPVFRHEPVLTVENLDLLILFFDHITLQIDGFNIDEKNYSQIINKLDAYIEAGYISVFSWDGNITTKISLKQPHINMYKYCKQIKSYTQFFYRPLSDFIQLIAEYETNTNKRLYPEQYKALSKKGFPLTDNPPAENTLNRINGYSKITDILGCESIYESWLRPFKSLNYVQKFSEVFKTGTAAELLVNWYGKKITEFPKFRNPETLIAFRNNISKESFLNTVLNEISKGKRQLSNEEICNKLACVLDNNIKLARKITGRAYRTKSTILSGLFSTLGGLIGGVPGAAIGGIGGSMATLIADRIDNKNVGEWATFFIE